MPMCFPLSGPVSDISDVGECVAVVSAPKRLFRRRKWVLAVAISLSVSIAGGRCVVGQGGAAKILAVRVKTLKPRDVPCMSCERASGDMSSKSQSPHNYITQEEVRCCGDDVSVDVKEWLKASAVIKSPPASARHRVLQLLGLSLGVYELQSPLVARALSGDEKQVTTLFEKITPGVVSISREPPLSYAGEERPGGSIAGSGFVWDANHVVTNFHVIQGMGAPFVTFLTKDAAGVERRTTLDAVLVGSDPASDVAVLRVGARARDAGTGVPAGLMFPLPRTTSSKILVGQNVFAFGNPFGLEHSLSRGIVSGVARKMDGPGGRPINGVIQTDASINPGNSGGPLLNSDGDVIGVNTAILTGSGTFAGVGLAIPIDTVSKNVESIINKGFVRRPVLGIAFAPDIMAEELQLNGIMVMKVVPGGPAEKAGVRPMRGGRLGDVVVQLGGKRVSSTDDLFAALELLAPGDEIPIKVQRASADATVDKYEDVMLTVTLGSADKV